MEDHKKPVGSECLFCLSSFPSEDLLEAHIKIHIGETSKLIPKKNTENLKCKSIITIKGTSTNIKTIGVPPCCQCRKVFSSRSLLKIHYKNVHTRKLYSCDLCANWYLYPRNLNRHKKIVHLGVVPDPICDQCNLSFADNSLLWSHKKIAHLKTLFECSICMKTYTALRNLQRHQRKMQHFSSKFHPETAEVKKSDHLDKKEKKLFATASWDDPYQPINCDRNSKKTKSIKVEKQMSSTSTKMTETGIAPLELGEKFPVMVKSDMVSPVNLPSYLELLKNQSRDESNDMFFLHLNRYKFND